MFGKIAKDVPPVVDHVGDGFLNITGFHHGPIDPNFIQRIDEAGCFKPILERGGSMLSSLPIND